jgi:hypothetical protein
MVTTFPQLHDDIQQPRLALLLASSTFTSVPVSSQDQRRILTVDGINVLLQQPPVPETLHLGHADVEVDLLLWQ